MVRVKFTMRAVNYGEDLPRTTTVPQTVNPALLQDSPNSNDLPATAVALCYDLPVREHPQKKQTNRPTEKPVQDELEERNIPRSTVSPGRSLTMEFVKELSPEVAVHRGRSVRSQTPSPPGRASVGSQTHSPPGRTAHELQTGKQDVTVARVGSAPVTDLLTDLYYSGKLTISLDTRHDFRMPTSYRASYFPFHPDKHYSYPSGARKRCLTVDEDSQSCRYAVPPNMKGKVLVHWYIALNQPARLGCPLEASPEAWDPRGQRVIPVTDIIETSSGFNNKTHRDTLAKFYLLMYYSDMCQQEEIVDSIKLLRRLGVDIDGRRLSPMVLVCTFCGQYSDVEWKHIELFDKRVLAQRYLSNLGRDPKHDSPLRVGMLSVLTCNHPDCNNNSAGGVPPRSQGVRRDDEDFFCQLFTSNLAKGQHKMELMRIMDFPTGYFPSHLGGEVERMIWEKRDLDENTVRFLRLEAYFNMILKEYWNNCRVCGESVLDVQRDWSNTEVLKYAQKGNICTPGYCTWSEANKITFAAMEAEFGMRWTEMVERSRVLRRGGSYVPLQQKPNDIFYIRSPESPSRRRRSRTPHLRSTPPRSLLDDEDFFVEGELSNEERYLDFMDTDEELSTEDEREYGGDGSPNGDMDLDESHDVFLTDDIGTTLIARTPQVERELEMWDINGLVESSDDIMDWNE